MTSLGIDYCIFMQVSVLSTEPLESEEELINPNEVIGY